MGRPDSGIRRYVTKTCPECEQEFTTSDPYYPQQKFCTRTCNLRSKNRDKYHQVVAGRAGGATRAAGYEPKVKEAKPRSLRPAKPSTYRTASGKATHRSVAEQELGRQLSPDEVVHHEDLNKHNNEPNNLIVFPSHSVHSTHHALKHCGGPCGCPGIRLGGDI